MPQVTAITPQKRPGRYNVFLDGRFALGLDELTLAKAGVHLGNEIDQAQLVKLKGEGETGKLYDKVLRFLAVRPRSEKEVRDYLHKKISNITRPSPRLRRVPLEALAKWGKNQISKISVNTEDTVGDIVERLKKSGLVDDEKFARWWVEQRQGARKPKGGRVIESELRQKGVVRTLVDEVLKTSSTDEIDLVRRAAEKKQRLWKALPPREFRQKMAQYLLRQGFSWPTVKKVLKDFYQVL